LLATLMSAGLASQAALGRARTDARAARDYIAVADENEALAAPPAKDRRAA
jgi:hypothetical protein